MITKFELHCKSEVIQILTLKKFPDRIKYIAKKIVSLPCLVKS